MTPVGIRDGWVRPVGHDPSGSPSWTRLGTLDGLGEPIVDPCGFVQVAPGAPGVAWWIAGDDRWYVPSREKTVRQSLFHNTPVVETRMRVKGGDVCLRTYAVAVSDSTGLREVVAMEVENTTGVPCGIAFAVRPFGVATDVPITSISIDGGVVSADGAPLVVLPAPPAGALSAVGADGDLHDRVIRGEATGSSFQTVTCPAGAAQAVVVVPLAHRNVFRIALPVPDSDGTVRPVTSGLARALPPAENVARGWRAQVRTCARVAVPDPRLHAVLGAAAPWALATTNQPLMAIGRSAWDTDRTPRWDHVAAVAGMLDRLGLHQRAGVLLARSGLAYSENPVGDASWLVVAYRDHAVRAHDGAFAEAVAEQCVSITRGLFGRRARDVPAERRASALDAAAGVLDLAGEPAASSAARKSARQVVGIPTDRVPETLDPAQGRCGDLLMVLADVAHRDGGSLWEVLDRYLDAVTSTGVWSATAEGWIDPHSVGLSAAVVSLALDFLVTGQDHRLRLIAHLPDAWVGRPIEVERVATDLGRVGYVARWHGQRPALLWELIPESTPDLVTPDLVTPDVLAPGLDSTWRGAGVAGEALLGAVQVASEPPRSGSRISGLQIGTSRGVS